MSKNVNAIALTSEKQEAGTSLPAAPLPVARYGRE